MHFYPVINEMFEINYYHYYCYYDFSLYGGSAELHISERLKTKYVSIEIKTEQFFVIKKALEIPFQGMIHLAKDKKDIMIQMNRFLKYPLKKNTP